MNKIFLLILFNFIVSIKLVAQGNLQFNQVIRPTVTAVNLAANGYTSIQLTIPAGKVWKVESADLYRYSTVGGVFTSSIMTTLHLRFGEQLINTIYTSTGIYYASLPKWYPASTYNFTILEASGQSQNTNTIVGVMNVIEFNIVQ
jgi:hypothetical protein